MSVTLKLSDENEEKVFQKRLTIKNENDQTVFIRGSFPLISVPFAFGKMQKNQVSMSPPLRDRTFPQFNGKLRPEQEIVFEQAKLMMATKNYCMISCYTGFGKTITTIALSCFFRLKTIIVCHRVCLFNQWTHSIETFSKTARVVKLPEEQDQPYDFGIVMISSIGKLSTIPDNILLITDETHLLLSEKRSLNLLSFHPVKLLGLTATPYRPDELHQLFKLFFGTNYIYKPLYKVHNVYQVNSSITIENRYIRGKLDWNYVLEQQCDNEERNAIIKDILQSFPKNRTWLVLVKRKRHATLLETLLQPHFKLSVLVGTQQNYDETCNVLIGTVGKIGTGFDFPTLDSLLIATDMVEYYIQFLGRVMRTKNTPVVVDIVDNHGILMNHFQKRKRVYLNHGGRVFCANPQDMKKYIKQFQ